MILKNEQELAALCVALIGSKRGLSPDESELAGSAGVVIAAGFVKAIASQIKKGLDPLGEAFSTIRSADERRSKGAVYTPMPIVRSMMGWISKQGVPARVVDPGAGSGRFILAAGAAFPKAELIAVELDPLAALMLRANLAARGWSDRAKVIVKDYREVALPRCKGATAFVGNPPYVRHHDIGDDWKAWYSEKFAALGIKASALAGLHLHFFLQTTVLGRKGDFGAFITSAEWMDVNYGSALRSLLLKDLGGVALHVLAPTVEAFPGTATTAAITCFRVGERHDAIRVRSVDDLSSLNGLTKGRSVEASTLQSASRWSSIVRPLPAVPVGSIELGELFRVHRGQVTGANDVWIAGDEAAHLPAGVMFPAVTKAKDLIHAGARLESADVLRRVVDLPPDLDQFNAEERRRITAFLSWARKNGADQSYIAQHRKAWWAVGLKPPAPILCTYMARRPPQFTRNSCDARHINVAHGLYPRQAIAAPVLERIVSWLNTNIHQGSGRTYAGGLTKFEPKEIERLRIPALDVFA